MRALLVQLIDAGGAMPRLQAEPLLAALDPAGAAGAAAAGRPAGQPGCVLRRDDPPRLPAPVRAWCAQCGRADRCRRRVIPASRRCARWCPASALPAGGHPAYRVLGDQALRSRHGRKADPRRARPARAGGKLRHRSGAGDLDGADRCQCRAVDARGRFPPRWRAACRAGTAAPLWRWRGLARRKADASPRGPAAGHFAALKEWKAGDWLNRAEQHHREPAAICA